MAAEDADAVISSVAHHQSHLEDADTPMIPDKYNTNLNSLSRRLPTHNNNRSLLALARVLEQIVEILRVQVSGTFVPSSTLPRPCTPNDKPQELLQSLPSNNSTTRVSNNSSGCHVKHHNNSDNKTATSAGRSNKAVRRSRS